MALNPAENTEITNAGFAIVPDSGTTDPAKVRNGGTEINRTRYYIALLKNRFMDNLSTVPVNKGGTGATVKGSARTNLGIMSGTSEPPSGASGDIYFKIIG